MTMRDKPWYRKFLDNPPPVPAHLWELMLMVALVLVGLVLGMTLCLVRQEHVPALTTPTLQQQLQSMEQRLRALERR
jgi:hypothetical protein